MKFGNVRGKVGPGIATAALAFGACVGPAHAQLTGGAVVAGKATITQPTATSTLITQTSPTALLTWTGFSIPHGSSVTFQQPSASAIALNRVLGGSPSFLYGSLSANGQVWLINPAGIVVGSGGNISAAGVLLSTADIHNADFLAGNYSFDIPGNAGAGILNRGTITAGTGGSVVLAGAHVTNDGLIAAELGSVVVAGASTYAVDFSGDGLLSFAVTSGSAASGVLVDNKGTISAPGGVVLLTAQAAKSVLDNVINTSGIVEATSAANVNGKIVLSAEGGGTAVSGTLDASGKGAGQTGGTVEVLGDAVTVASGARIDVSGDAGGGLALVGGNFHGAGPEANALTTTVAAGSIIDADAITGGNGGRVAVWSDGATSFAGSITARGGATGGNGGYVETSGESLGIAGGSVVTAALAGAGGTWLLDPFSLTIDAVLATIINNALVNGGVVVQTTASSASATSTAGAAVTPLNIPGGDTNSSGTGDITVAAPIHWSTGSEFIISAFRNIDINVPITSTGNGAVVLIADNTGIGTGTVVFGGTGTPTPGAVSATNASTIIFYNATNFPTQDSFPQITGPLTAYMLVANVIDLQNIANNLSGDYALATDLDATTTQSWNSGAGFLPVGPFAGVFLGQEHTISNLFINSTASEVGLFSSIAAGGEVASLSITNANVSGSTSGADVGILAGSNLGTVSGVATSGFLTATGDGGSDGGLVGYNDGNIASSSSAAVVNGLFNIGGLVGESGGGVIEFSFASGSVSGTGENPYAGGLAGWLTGGAIMQSYAIGPVTTSASAGDSGTGGGLIGSADEGSVSTSYALGSVTGAGSGPEVGGLIGRNSVAVDQVFSTGMVTFNASGFGGPLIGLQDAASPPTSAYWDSDTAGQPSNNVGAPLTTAQLESGLPPGFDPAIWGSNSGSNNSLPFLPGTTTVTTPIVGSPPPVNNPGSGSGSGSNSNPVDTSSSPTAPAPVLEIKLPSIPIAAPTTTATSSQALPSGSTAPPAASSEPASTLSGDSGSGASGGLTSVSDIDPGSSLFNQISGGSGGSSSTDPLTAIAPITPAPQALPLPLVADVPLGGAGSDLFLASNFTVASDLISSVGNGPPSDGNNSDWFWTKRH